MPRHLIDIKQKDFEGLCRLQCSEIDIAGWFGCSVDTIDRWCKRTYKRGFAEVFAEKRVGGRISLRRSQFALAEKSAAMAIFLGKNYLGQRDENYVNVTDDRPTIVDNIPGGEGNG